MRYRPQRPQPPSKRNIAAVNRFYASASPKDVELPEIPPERAPRQVVKRTGPTPEGEVNIAIRAAFKGDPRVALFRNNRGLAIYPGGAKVAYGVGPNGSADWLGWKTVRITQDMVGKSLAVFVSIEAKAPGERAEDDQEQWAERVRAAGGIAGIAHSDKEAIHLIEGK